MPDITMCTGGDCPKRETCWRFTAPPNGHQSYYSVPPCNIMLECAYYWPNRSATHAQTEPERDGRRDASRPFTEEES